MANKQKSSKAGRKAKKGQNLKYKNEHRREQNKLRRLKAHVQRNGMTGSDARDAMRKCEIVLFGVPKTVTPVNPKRPRSAELEAKSRQMRLYGVAARQAA